MLVLVNHNTCSLSLSLSLSLSHTHTHTHTLTPRYGRLGLAQQLVDKVPGIALRLTSEGYNALHIAHDSTQVHLQ